MDHKRKKNLNDQHRYFDFWIVYCISSDYFSSVKNFFYFTYFLLPELDVIISSSHNDGDNNGNNGDDNSKDNVINNSLLYIMWLLQ